MERLLLTGAAGRVATLLRPRLLREDRTVHLLDVEPIDDIGAGEEAFLGSAGDLTVLREACADVHAIVHLATTATSRPMAFDAALEDLATTRAVLEAAHEAGIHRVVYASSNHAVGFHPRGEVAAPDWLFPRPDTYYGVSKVAAEGLASLYVDRYGMDIVCLRIGTCRPEPNDVRSLATWLSPDDAARLVEASIAAPSPGFQVVWGVSANTRNWWSLDGARSLGYEPQDDAEVFADQILAEHGEPDPAAPDHRYLGGGFTTRT